VNVVMVMARQLHHKRWKAPTKSDDPLASLIEIIAAIVLDEYADELLKDEPPDPAEPRAMRRRANRRSDDAISR
jgi:hypothetical protein